MFASARTASVAQRWGSRGRTSPKAQKNILQTSALNLACERMSAYSTDERSEPRTHTAGSMGVDEVHRFLWCPLGMAANELNPFESALLENAAQTLLIEVIHVFQRTQNGPGTAKQPAAQGAEIGRSYEEQSARRERARHCSQCRSRIKQMLDRVKHYGGIEARGRQTDRLG